MTKALEQVPTNSEERYYEREIRATFENGGHIEMTARGDGVSEVLSILMAAVAVVKLNRDSTFSFRLSYWHLTEDCVDLEIAVSQCAVDFDEPDAMRTVRRMVKKAKADFLAKLAMFQITLVGPRGELPK